MPIIQQDAIVVAQPAPQPTNDDICMTGLVEAVDGMINVTTVHGLTFSFNYKENGTPTNASLIFDAPSYELFIPSNDKMLRAVTDRLKQMSPDGKPKTGFPSNALVNDPQASTVSQAEAQ